MGASKVEYHPLIRDMSPTDRPRERLRAHGASALSPAELLAIILRTGSASKSAVALATDLLAHFGGLSGLVNASIGELCGVKGIGEAKACQVQAALQIARSLGSLQLAERDVVKSPEDVFHLLQHQIGFLEQEELWVVLLNNRNQVVKTQHVYTGNINTAVVRIADVFKMAIRENSPAFVVAHNHPSGDPTPSPDDVKVTADMV
ncbi:MAG: DNA repair protein RadC, partial [Chloroflexi bacterium]|nr:DNA repair protein RadC [Chloroflexota bacterium]